MKLQDKKPEVIQVKVLKLLRQEPVRVYVYSLVAAIVVALVFFGVVTSAAVPVIMGVVISLLALPSPVEAVRNRVTPVDKEERQYNGSTPERR